MIQKKRRCNVCKKKKTLDEFYRNSKFPLGRTYTCKLCMNEAGTARYQRNKEEINRKRREETRRLKLEVVDGYGGHCECCGEDRWQFLNIDHRNGGGTAERRNAKNKNPLFFYKRLVAEGFPKEKFRLLCWNCNLSIGLYGSCPHTEEKVA